MTHSEAVAIARSGEGAVVATLTNMQRRIDNLEGDVLRLQEKLEEALNELDKYRPV